MTANRQHTLDRTDLIAGLRELLTKLHNTHTTARIRIVGRAEIALIVHADQPATVDIDGPLEPAEPVLAAAHRIAARRGWRLDWINDAAAAFVPSGLGDRSPESITIHRDNQVKVQVASPETLLAVKLHAAQRRGDGDAQDLASLLPLCNISSAIDAEELHNAHYPGDGFTLRTRELVERILEANPASPAAPPRPDLA